MSVPHFISYHDNNASINKGQSSPGQTQSAGQIREFSDAKELIFFGKPPHIVKMGGGSWNFFSMTRRQHITLDMEL